MQLVIVTYGTLRNQVYASARTPSGAMRLKAAAVTRGYTDARVVDAKEFREAQDTKGTSRRRAEILDRGPSGVHDMRRQSGPPPSRQAP